MQTATYSPEDNKLRLYSEERLDPETYARARAAGFIWAPHQKLFVAPRWTPTAADLLLELCGEIGDEDTSLVDRAEDRADRFEDYSERRAQDAGRASDAVHALSDNIPLGQPILVGHHSEKRARRVAEKIQNEMSRAVKLWDQADYWKSRAAGAIRLAKYKELPDVRARRIRGLEADQRRHQKELEHAQRYLAFWTDASLTQETAERLANYSHVCPPAEMGWCLWSALHDGKCTVEQARKIATAAYLNTIAYAQRWLVHLDNRLAYERAMYAESGGTAADQTRPEVGGAVQCWASIHGGWSYIKKVNKVSVTIEDNWGNGGRNFTRTIELTKLRRVMSAAQVEAARAAGRLLEAGNSRPGFFLAGTDGPEPAPLQPAPPTAAEPAITTPAAERPPVATQVAAMRESLRAGVQVAVVPQFFPTPPEIGRRMVAECGLLIGKRVLEPSAGAGHLVRAIADNATGFNLLRVVAIEVNLALVGFLKAMRRRSLYANEWNFDIRHADFLELQPPELGLFDAVVMNPPFENGADIKHIHHALKFLKPGGRLVALCANGPRQQEALSNLGKWTDLPADSFKSVGTRVNVAMLTMLMAESHPLSTTNSNLAVNQPTLF